MKVEDWGLPFVTNQSTKGIKCAKELVTYQACLHLTAIIGTNRNFLIVK